MNEKLEAWSVETTDLTARVVAAIGRPQPSVETELLEELRALRRELGELRSTTTQLQEEVARLRQSPLPRRITPFAAGERRIGLS